eukprot:scaffold50162_cov41-Phaeocystis_antarctica.AAC.1
MTRAWSGYEADARRVGHSRGHLANDGRVAERGRAVEQRGRQRARIAAYSHRLRELGAGTG